LKASELFVRCLENEGVRYVFGLPGEEALPLVDSISSSSLTFITTRHEQGAAFMADVHGRLTGRAGVCLSTLGPGATNLVTGVADANLDMAPLVAVAGQAPTSRLHKQSHQVIDLVRLYEPLVKFSVQIHSPRTIPEIVRKAFKLAESETPGACFIEFPQDVAETVVHEGKPLSRHTARLGFPHPEAVAQAAALIDAAESPLLMAGHGVIRQGASDRLVALAEELDLPVVTTFMAKGVVPASHPLHLGAAGLQTNDYSYCGFKEADLIICVGFDMVEYRPQLWRRPEHQIIHIHATPAEVDEDYSVTCEVIGQIGPTLDALRRACQRRQSHFSSRPRRDLLAELAQHADDQGFPLKPQKIVSDLRRVLGPDDLVICDVGAHKLWMARLYQAERPNTCIISNGFAAMGIAVPGAVAAALIRPERRVVAVTGDGGFLLNSQELETAVRLGLDLVVLIWSDASYGLIGWKETCAWGRTSCVDFGNPDFALYARSFGAEGHRVEKAADLLPMLQTAVRSPGVTVIDCPVDYRENLSLTERLGSLVCSD
jgi:acetolactate synthase-1/2/3 large subunit